jgi:hypothetical protein
MGFDNFRLSNIDLVNIANFQYENGLESIAFSIKDEPDRVYGQILDPKTGKEKNYIIADFDYEKFYDNRPIITFNSLYFKF